ncbi:MAG: 30S ribosomal protein S16 [Thermoleophilaceae bacterium]|nr:30S ribosomal protein S16 [Thermoleophilaceae bacterium]
MVRIRLTRVGSKKNPIWRIVVADKRSPRDGRVIENVGTYNPQTDPSTVTLKQDRVEHWIEKGAKPTPTVLKLMKTQSLDADGKPVAVK